RDGRFVGECQSRSYRHRFAIRPQPIDSNRFRDVLELLLTQIIESELCLAANMVENSPRDDDAPGIGQGLDPCGYIDPITVEVIALDHNVAQIDADSQSNSPALRQVCIGGLHTLLQLDSAFDGIHGAGKLDQDAVANVLDDAAAMPVDGRPQDLRA